MDKIKGAEVLASINFGLDKNGNPAIWADSHASASPWLIDLVTKVVHHAASLAQDQLGIKPKEFDKAGNLVRYGHLKPVH